MKKRAYDRVPANLDFRCFDIEYFGTITDMSENGMFIKSQHISFPLDSSFIISLRLKDSMLEVPVKVRRMTKSNGYYDGLGVEVTRRPRNYVKLVKRLRTISKSEEKNPI